MKDAAAQTIYLANYKVSPFLIETTKLEIDLQEQKSIVTSELQLRRNPDSPEGAAPLVLDGGSAVDLQWVEIDGRRLDTCEYERTEDSLTIAKVPDTFVISTEVHIQPHLNTTMMGLYRSRKMYCLSLIHI